MVTSSSLGSRLKQMSNEAGKESKQLDLELREMDILLKQTTGEIEKLTQRQTDASSRLRQVEATIEGYSPADIKSTYREAQEANLRLFMMRSQLELLQSKQRTLERFKAQIDGFASAASQVTDALEDGPVTTVGNAPTTEQRAIVSIIEAQEAERQHLSRQMHDGPAQSLTNLILQAEIVERIFDVDPARAKTELSNLKTAANTTFQRIRDFIFELRPMMLDDLGLIPTLKRYIQTFESKTHLPTQLAVSGEKSFSPHLEVTLYRAVQELLTNVARHAHASRVQVNLELQGDPVVAVVEDDGSGFDVGSTLAESRRRGTSGLADIEKTIGMLGGKIQFQSGSGHGTKIRLEIPTG